MGEGWENLQSKRLQEAPYLHGCADEPEKGDGLGKDAAGVDVTGASCEKGHCGFLQDSISTCTCYSANGNKPA